MLIDPRKLEFGRITMEQAQRLVSGVRVSSHDCQVGLSVDGRYLAQAESLSYLDGDTVSWRFVSNSLSDCATIVLLHPDDGTLLGYSTLSFHAASGGGAPGLPELEVDLDMMFVDANYRGCGYGGTLAAASAQFAQRYIAEASRVAKAHGGGPIDVGVSYNADESAGGRALAPCVESAILGYAESIQEECAPDPGAFSSRQR